MLLKVVLMLYSVIGLTISCTYLRIRDWDLNEIGDIHEINSGDLVALICDGTCQGPGFTPSLKWIQPDGRKVQSFPGRLMSVYQESRRQIKLYLQDFQHVDQGVYTCRGWVNGKWRIRSVFLRLSEPDVNVLSTPDVRVDSITTNDK